MRQRDRAIALLETEWMTTLVKSVDRLGGVVKINSNLVRLYSGGIIPRSTMHAFKDAMEKRDPKKLLVVAVAKEDRPE